MSFIRSLKSAVSSMGCSKARPANFDSPDYKPCGMNRVNVDREDITALGEVNSVFLIDDSSSTVWEKYVQYGELLNWDVMTRVAPQLFDVITRYDPNGACLYFMNYKSKPEDEPGLPDEGLPDTGFNHIQNPEYMMKLMDKARPPHPRKRNAQGTPTGPRIKYITDAYLDRCADKSKPPPPPINLIVWTDGESDNDAYLRRVIVEICLRLQALRMPPNQIGIQFFQVGNISGVSQKLKALDDNIKGSDGVKIDIVDTRRQEDIESEGGFNPVAIITLLLGSFVRQIDGMKKYGVEEPKPNAGAFEL